MYKLEKPKNVLIVVTPRIRIGYEGKEDDESWSYYPSSYLADPNNGTVRSVPYGNERLWVVMVTGNLYYVTLNSITYPRYNRTLAVFPFTSPYQLESPPASIVTTPRNLTCYESEIQTCAVFGDKMYYSDRVSG
ncbi:hypothetical protein CPB97_009219 [Podila verticillata]|nr:hypothetical protein CPB97_009219 [Podila verticillata]